MIAERALRLSLRLEGGFSVLRAGSSRRIFGMPKVPGGGSSFDPDAVAAYLFAQDLTTTEVLDEKNTGTQRAGQTGRAYDFDGTNDYVLFDSIDLGSFTFSAWINPDVLGATGGTLIAEVGSGDYLYVTSTTVVFRLGSIDYSLTTDPDFVTGEWQHFVFVRDGADISAYRNNLEVAPPTTTDGTTFSPTRIGVYGTAGKPFNGKMFDVRVYDDVLTTSEIQYLYTFGDSGTDPTSSNLQLLYKCEDSHDTEAFDSSGNSNDGAKTNISSGSFNYEDGSVPYSYQNSVGFSEGRNKEPNSNMVTGWGVTNVTRTTGQPDPWGGNTANLLTASTASSTRFYTSETSRAINGNIYSVFVKPNGYNYVLLSSHISSIPATRGTFFDIANGTIGTKGTPSQNAWIEDAGNGWYRIAIDKGGSPSSIFSVLLSPDGVTASFTGDGSSGIYVAGAQWEEDTGPVPFQPTPFQPTDGESHVGAFIPADESDPTKDVFGNPLEYTGIAPRDAKLIESNCGTFDATNDYIDTGISFNATSSYDIRCRFVRSGISSSEYIFSGNDATTDGLSILMMSDGTINIRHNVGSSSGQTVNSYADGQPHELRAQWDGSEITLTVDSEVITNSRTGAISTTLNLVLGARIFSGVNNVFGGSLFDYQVSANGSELFYYPLAEGSGTAIYDVSGNDNHGTATNITESSFWGSTQDAFHYNILNGFEHYDDDATGTDIIRVPYKTDGSQITPTISGYTKNQNNPAGKWHNDAETAFDFTGGVDAPWWNTLESDLGVTIPTSYNYGDSLPANMLKQTGSQKEFEFQIKDTT